MIGGYVLYRILDFSFEDSAPIKLFFFVQWFDGNQQRLVVVTDGQRWWRRRLGVLGEGLGEKRGEKCVFYTAGHIYNLQDSLGRAGPTQIRLGEFWENHAQTYFTTFVKMSYLTLQMLFCKSQWSR